MDNKNDPPPVNQLIRIPEITFTTGFVLALGVLVFTLLFVFLPSGDKDDLLFLAAACTAAGTLAAAFYSARVLQYTVNSQASSNQAAAQEAKISDRRYLDTKAENFARRWNDATMFHVRQHCSEIIKNRSNPEVIKTKLADDEAFSANVRHILNFLEEIAICINGTRCDEAIAKSFFCGIVLNVWHASEFYVKETRIARGRTEVWADLESLYGRWK